jgi:hypothetical protein
MHGQRRRQFPDHADGREKMVVPTRGRYRQNWGFLALILNSSGIDTPKCGVNCGLQQLEARDDSARPVLVPPGVSVA